MKRNAFAAAIAGMALAALGVAAGAWWQTSRLQAQLMELRTALSVAGFKTAANPPAAPSQPEMLRVPLTRAADPSLGSERAPVTVVEFSDYECPFCRKFFTTTFNDLKREHIDSGRVRYVVYDYPVKYHKNAVKAAQASRCAAEQGKYWEMRQALFEHSKSLGADRILAYAKGVGLDLTKFRQCFGSDKYLAAIQEGIAVAGALGISGTPTFVVGRMEGRELRGRKLVGALPFATFDQYLRESLSATAAKNEVTVLPPTTK